MKELMEILESLRPDVDFSREQRLIDDGILDSFDLVSLVSEINDAFKVEIGVEHMEPANFNSVAAMFRLIDSLQE